MEEYDYPLHADESYERDGKVVLWSNPDVPDAETIGGVEVFTCPGLLDDDPFHGQKECLDEKCFEAFDDRDQLAELIESENGTLRCEECNEPLYGIYGDGDARTG